MGNFLVFANFLRTLIDNVSLNRQKKKKKLKYATLGIIYTRFAHL